MCIRDRRKTRPKSLAEEAAEVASPLKRALSARRSLEEVQLYVAVAVVLEVSLGPGPWPAVW
eukprot:1458037-Alexandrium_andersonii.AAC.1